MKTAKIVVELAGDFDEENAKSFIKEELNDWYGSSNVAVDVYTLDNIQGYHNNLHTKKFTENDLVNRQKDPSLLEPKYKPVYEWGDQPNMPYGPNDFGETHNGNLTYDTKSEVSK